MRPVSPVRVALDADAGAVRDADAPEERHQVAGGVRVVLVQPHVAHVEQVPRLHHVGRPAQERRRPRRVRLEHDALEEHEAAAVVLRACVRQRASE